MRNTASPLTRKGPLQVFCNGAPFIQKKRAHSDVLPLEYRSDLSTPQNVQLKLPDFIEGVFYLPDRVQDLLEIAAYVFCADRHLSRGDRRTLEYHSWSREFQYFIRVRDAEFWNSSDVKRQLNDALSWMTGDRSHKFDFLSGHKTARTGLFESEEHALTDDGNPRVMLFSGGLDSLVGAIDLLETTESTVWPISHSSANARTVHTQRKLIEALQRDYGSRINWRVLTCHLHGVRAPEESQRTRAFLYCSMAFALALRLGQSRFYVYENGVTALNFPKRGGMINARASRTAHPKTLRLLERLFSLVAGQHFIIETPFQQRTKTDVLEILKKHKKAGLLNASVSCSKTFKEMGNATHCGECSQCVDRRFAAYAADCDSADNASGYDYDFIHESVRNGETKTTIIDYLRQARTFVRGGIGHFQDEFAVELADALDTQEDEVKQVEDIYALCRRHGQQVQNAASKMIRPLEDYPVESLQTFLHSKDLAQPPEHYLAQQIAESTEGFIRRAFSKEKPTDENDLNAKISAFLAGHRERFEREHPCLTFATARTIPDHSRKDCNLLIETKYIRGATSPSKATEGIAADLTKYPSEALKLFLVYDPEGKIPDREAFITDFERKGNCIVRVI